MRGLGSKQNYARTRLPAPFCQQILCGLVSSPGHLSLQAELFIRFYFYSSTLVSSSMRLYFENPAGRLLEHPDGYALVQYTAAPRNFAVFQAFLTHTHHLLRRRGWHKMLADQRLMPPFTDEERQWIGQDWLARSASEGYALFGAIIIPTDVYARLTQDLAMNPVQQNSALTYRLFTTEDEATAWLRQLP